MAEERNVTIVSWPGEPAELLHKFKLDEPCPVSILFEKAPANVRILTDERNPLHVDMEMHVSAKEPIPVCIQLCEPICIDSKYHVGISLFQNPIMEISVEGRSRLANCRDTKQPPQVKRVCVDFDRLPEDAEFSERFEYDQLVFTPLDGSASISTWGAPNGVNKLTFPHDGIRIEFPHPVEIIDLKINNYGGSPEIKLEIYGDSGSLGTRSEAIANTVKDVSIEQEGVTAISIHGGNNEASIVEVCYS